MRRPFSLDHYTVCQVSGFVIFLSDAGKRGKYCAKNRLPDLEKQSSALFLLLSSKDRVVFTEKDSERSRRIPPTPNATELFTTKKNPETAHFI